VNSPEKIGAHEELSVHEAVPNKLPVIPPTTVNDPVIFWLPVKLFEPVVANEPVLIFPPTPYSTSHRHSITVT